MSMSECARGQAMASVNTTSDASYLAGNFWMLTDCVISEKSRHGCVAHHTHVEKQKSRLIIFAHMLIAAGVTIPHAR